MKKILSIVVVMFVIATFFIIADRKSYVTKEQDTTVFNEKDSPKTSIKDPVKALYFSYIELERYIKGKDEETIKKNIDTVIDNMYKDGFNWLILHVRPFSDSIYPSKIFPNSKNVTNDELPFDLLKYFVDKAHQKDIQVHAWVNPYRISNQTDFKIEKDHPAYNFLNTNNIKVIEGKGIYYNPASSEVQSLIVSGIDEIVTNYDVDGIHFDDYFFPGGDIDKENYEEYQKKGGTLSLSDYRLNNTSTMIKKVYDTIKEKKKDVLFGIAPEGNINNNYNSNYLDTKKYLSQEGYLDYIMPQIYFGFLNENRPFTKTIEEWNNLIKVDGIKLIPALALYKSGEEDKYAGSGLKEWQEHNDILKRQIIYARNLSNYQGFTLFRYDYFYNSSKQNKNTLSEVDNVRNIIKK